MLNALIFIVYFISQALIWIVILSALLSFIMDPYHVIRRTIDQIVDPMLRPIRRIVPNIGIIDISPIVLIIIIQLVSYILRSLLFSLS